MSDTYRDNVVSVKMTVEEISVIAYALKECKSSLLEWFKEDTDIEVTGKVTEKQFHKFIDEELGFPSRDLDDMMSKYEGIRDRLHELNYVGVIFPKGE